MWTADLEQLNSGSTLNVRVRQGALPISFADVLSLWKNDETFRTFFIGLLKDCPFPVFRWETPALTIKSSLQPFEFVMLDSPGLASHPDPHAFASHFANPGAETVVAFPNLGRDALLIVPCPVAPDSAYGHIAAFHRHAPDSQKHTLWKLVGRTLEQELGSKPIWLSTAGAGVSWLHVRLDQTPKYYGFAPYRLPK